MRSILRLDALTQSSAKHLLNHSGDALVGPPDR